MSCQRSKRICLLEAVIQPWFKRGRRFLVARKLAGNPDDVHHLSSGAVPGRWGQLEEVILGRKFLLDSACTCPYGQDPGGVCRHAAAAWAEFARNEASVRGATSDTPGSWQSTASQVLGRTTAGYRRRACWTWKPGFRIHTSFLVRTGLVGHRQSA